MQDDTCSRKRGHPHRPSKPELKLHRARRKHLHWQAKGFKGYQLQRSIESPGRYLLLIRWETLENHTVDFRGSAAFAEWRAIVGPFFAQPPVVEHLELVAQG